MTPAFDPSTRQLARPAIGDAIAATLGDQPDQLAELGGLQFGEREDPVRVGCGDHLHPGMSEEPDELLLATANNGRLGAGRRLLRTGLTLARHGLAVHPLSQLIDCPATAGRLAERVAGQPLAVFRVGRPRGRASPALALLHWLDSANVVSYSPS